MSKYIDLDDTIENLNCCILANGENELVKAMFEFTIGILLATPTIDENDLIAKLERNEKENDEMFSM